MTVFVLTLKSWAWGDSGPIDHEVVGVYRTLEAVRADQAARYRGCCDRYGTIHLDWQWGIEEVPSPWNKE
jgi:hypothetical protein